MTSRDKVWQHVAACSCFRMAKTGNTAKRAVAELGGIKKMCDLLKDSSSMEVCDQAGFMLREYTHQSTTRTRLAADAGAVVGLSKLARSRSYTGQGCAAETICNIADSLYPTRLPERQVKLAAAALAGLLREPDTQLKETALKALEAIMLRQPHAGLAALVVEAGSVPLITQQMVAGSPSHQQRARCMLATLLQTNKKGLAPEVVAAGGLQACLATLNTPGDDQGSYNARFDATTILWCLAEARPEYAAAMAAAGAVGPYTWLVAETLQRGSGLEHLAGLDALLEVGPGRHVEEALEAGLLPLLEAALQHPEPLLAVAAVNIATTVTERLRREQSDSTQQWLEQLEPLVQHLMRHLGAWLTAPPDGRFPPAMALLTLGTHGHQHCPAARSRQQRWGQPGGGQLAAGGRGWASGLCSAAAAGHHITGV